MNTQISAKELRASLPELVKKVQRGQRFTVLYRSRPAFQIIPADDTALEPGSLAEDTLYRAKAVGSSKDGLSATDHDRILYR